MISYFTGGVFILFYISFVYLVGKVTVKEKTIFSTTFVYGYLIFSFFVAIVGIPIQLLNLSWSFFQYSLIAVYLLLIVYIILRFKRRKIKIDIKEICSSQWIIIIVSLLLTLAAFCNVKANWLCNNMDDGFYMGIVSSQKEAINNFNTNPSTGFAEASLGSYLFNTIFTEYSVYSRLFSINSFILCHFHFAFFNYFLLGNVIAVLAEFIFKDKITKNDYQYFSVIMLLFGIPDYYLTHYILLVQDSWQFNTAMYYGSSIVRTAGSLLIILPFINHDRLYIKDVLGAMCISIVLMSKSSIALPVIVTTCLSYLLMQLFFSKKTRYISVGILILIMCFAVGYYFEGNPDINAAISNLFKLEMNRKLTFIPCCVMILLSFLYKNEHVNKINFILILMYLFMFISPLNKIFEVFSMYAFVGARMLAMVIYLTVILSFMYFIMGIMTISKNIRIVNFVKQVCTVCLIGSFTFLSIRYYGIDGLKLQIRNPSYIPNSTVELGKILETKYEETGNLNYVLCPEGVVPNSIVHSLATILRSVSPHSISVSAAGRFGEPESGLMEGYSSDYQAYFDKFVLGPSEETYADLKGILNLYPINCFVSQTTEVESYLSKDGFKLYDKVENERNGINYYIYVRG